MMWASMLICALGSDPDLVVHEKYRVEYVVLDIVAVDRKGHLVDDLKAEDFQVLENGDPVKVSLFDILDLTGKGVEAPHAADTAEPIEESEPGVPQVILTFDMEALKGRGQTQALNQAREFLASWDPAEPIRICVDSLETGPITDGFVDSAMAAMAALSAHAARLSDERHDRRRGFDSDRGWTQFDGGYGDLNGLEKALEQCIKFGGPVDQHQCIQSALDEYSLYHEEKNLRVIGELESLMYRFQETDGLKFIFLISSGFAMDFPRSAKELAQLYLNSASPGERTMPVAASSGTRIRQEYQRVVHACIRNRIIFYSFDIFNESAGTRRRFAASHSIQGGMRISGLYQQYQREAVEGLKQLADDSGGDFYQVDAFPSSMRNVLKNRAFFYVLGYESPSGERGEYRKIKVKCKRRGVDLHYRRGYVGAS